MAFTLQYTYQSVSREPRPASQYHPITTRYYCRFLIDSRVALDVARVRQNQQRVRAASSLASSLPARVAARRHHRPSSIVIDCAVRLMPIAAAAFGPPRAWLPTALEGAPCAS